MAEVTLQELLSASVVTRVISRYRTPMSKLQNFFGMGPGGPNTNPVGGKIFSWDVFDRTREIAQGRPPGTGPANRPPQKIGQVTANAYRSHEAVYLLDENLYRTRQLGNFWDRIDARGQGYVMRQQDYIAQKFKNNREFMVSRMLRGGFGIKISGDNWIPVELGAADSDMDVDFQVPSSSQGTCGSVLGGAWQTSTTDILGEILAMNAKFEEEHGWPLRHIWLNSKMYNYMLSNDSLRTVAGTSNTVFDTFQTTSDGKSDGSDDTGFNVRFRAIPWLDVHVYDGGLTVDGSYSKFLPDNRAAFLPDPSPALFEWLEGSELIRQNVVSEPEEAMGLTAWTTPSIDPAGFELKTIDSGIPALYVPKTMCWGTIAS